MDNFVSLKVEDKERRVEVLVEDNESDNDWKHFRVTVVVERW